MASTFIGLNHRSGTPRLKSYTNATASNLGNTFGSADNNSGGASVNGYLLNAPFCYFLGAFYSIAGGVIYKSTDLAVTWTPVYTIPNANLGNTFQSSHSGIQVVFNAGQPMMVIVTNGNTTKYAVWSTDGTTWNTTTGVLNPNNGYAFLSPVVYHGKLYVLAGSSITGEMTMWIFDPASQTLAVAVYGTVGGFGLTGGLCVCQDRLFMLQMDAANTYTLYEVQGSTFVSRVVVNVAGASYTVEYKDLLFTDGSFLYAIYLIPGATWKCKKIQLDTWTLTDISSTVLPAAMLTTPPNTGRIGMVTDGVAQPGSTPGRYIYYATLGDAVTPWSMFQWNGPASAMTFVDTGGLAADAMPFYTQVDGDVFFAAGQKKVEITARSAVGGGVRYSFKLWGGGTVSVRAFYCAATGEFPNTQATLANASAGSLSGNVISGLTADDGGTTYQVSWLAATDGFATGDFPKFLLEQM